MSVYEGVYKSFLQGVSQQTPQEREDGQLGMQLNMLSDPVTGLRRRGGVKFHALLQGINPRSYMRIVDIAGSMRLVVVDTNVGQLHVFNDFDAPVPTKTTFTNPYFKAVGKSAIRTTSARDNFFIVNTEKIPTVQMLPDTGKKDPSKFGYFSIRGSQFSKTFTITITYGSFSKTYTVTAHADIADQASPEWVATQFLNKLNGDGAFTAIMTATKEGNTVALEVKDKTSSGQLDVQTTVTGGYVMESGASRITSRSELLGTLPSALDGYILAVGNTGNTAYYVYNNTTKKWAETGAYSKPYVIRNEPMYFYLDSNDTVKLSTLQIMPRGAGDEDNNPLPKFIGYGITGISAYQSRLVILSGSYVNMSKTTDFNQFMRTSVTELLDDDPIEISSAALSSAQFEYALPYNKDLVLISSSQQAVIPANATVLTPRTAVIYPSTELDLSLAVEPTVVARTMYYAYQRGVEYYQIGEFIPNTYTDAQYYSQNLTDHIPLYAQGVCTTIASSSTNNMVVCCSDSKEVLVNQFLWRGDERALMSFHKWELPHKVMYAQFLHEYLILFMDGGADNTIVGTLNVQLNQLEDKPVPYMDLYQYVLVENGVGVVPSNLPSEDVVAAIYSSRTARHKEVQYSITGNTLKSPYNGTVVLGKRYRSAFTLTPPFIKDESGKVIAGARTTIQQLRMTFKSTGSFEVHVQDTMGVSYDGTGNTAYTWSEADLGYTWVNSIGSVTIPCRTQLSSTECTVSTAGTTDMNLVSTEYVLRLAQKRRRLG